MRGKTNVLGKSKAVMLKRQRKQTVKARVCCFHCLSPFLSVARSPVLSALAFSVTGTFPAESALPVGTVTGRTFLRALVVLLFPSSSHPVSFL